MSASKIINLRKSICVVRDSLTLLIFLSVCLNSIGQNKTKNSNAVLVLYENKGHHKAFTDRAVPWLKALAKDSGLSMEFITDLKKVDEHFLNRFNLFIQLDYVPYGWSETAKYAFTKFIDSGKGGWIGFHHAGLLGDFDGYKIWPWFSVFLGDIVYKNYIPGFASAIVINENNLHPVMHGLPDTFTIAKEEWYTWNNSPRPYVKVLAAVDENSYRPDSKIKMGDHPVIWTNGDVKAKNLYIFMGHDPSLLENVHFAKLFTNAIFWAIKPDPAN